MHLNYSLTLINKSNDYQMAWKDNNVKKCFSSKESVSGAKNAQLICIKDKSCYEEISESEGSKNMIENLELHEQTDEMDLNIPPSNRKAEKPPFGQLSKRFTINIVQYKLAFHKFTKSDHMYKKTPLIQPWILTSR